MFKLLFSFQQINEARMAFQLYEHMDNAGLVINEHIISRTLKLCGRAISHKKLMQHVSEENTNASFFIVF